MLTNGSIFTGLSIKKGLESTGKIERYINQLIKDYGIDLREGGKVSWLSNPSSFSHY